MKIAVIAWGSLVWDPRDLDIEPEWRQDGPLLPVEFARFSGRDRLTLVLVEGVPLQQTLWTLSRQPTLAAASSNLRAREETSSSSIHCWSRGSGLAAKRLVDSSIEDWLQRKQLDCAVWTALGPNDLDRKAGLSTEEQRMTYLKGLVAAGKAQAAREYFEKAPTQIATPFRGRVREELGWV